MDTDSLASFIRTNEPLSNEDAGAVKGSLNERIAQLVELDREVALLQERQTILKRLVSDHHSVLSPLRNFPSDLLLEIFSCFCEEDDEEYDPAYYPPLVLSSVCRRWREVVFEGKTLWKEWRIHHNRGKKQPGSDIHVMAPLDAWSKHVGSGLIEIVINTQEIDHTLPALASAIPVLAKEFHRCRSLDLCFDEPVWERALTAIADPDFSSLSALQVWFDEPKDHEEYLHYWGIGNGHSSHEGLEWLAPVIAKSTSLLHLHWNHTTTRLTAGSVPSQLVSLTLGSWRKTFCLEDEVLSIISHTPRLEYLSLHLDPQASATYVVLPNLEELDLEFKQNISGFFDHLTVPKLRILCIDTQRGAQGPFDSLVSFHERCRFELDEFMIEACKRQELIEPLIEFLSIPDIQRTLRVLDFESDAYSAVPSSTLLLHVQRAIADNTYPKLKHLAFSVHLELNDHDAMYEQTMETLLTQRKAANKETSAESSASTASHLKSLSITFIVGFPDYRQIGEDYPSAVVMSLHPSYVQPLDELNMLGVNTCWNLVIC